MKGTYALLLTIVGMLLAGCVSRPHQYPPWEPPDNSRPSVGVPASKEPLPKAKPRVFTPSRVTSSVIVNTTTKEMWITTGGTTLVGHHHWSGQKLPLGSHHGQAKLANGRLTLVGYSVGVERADIVVSQEALGQLKKVANDRTIVVVSDGEPPH